MPIWLKNINLFLNTVRYLSFKQIAYRGYYTARRAAWKFTRKKAELPACQINETRTVRISAKCEQPQQAVAIAQKISANTFWFLNTEISFGSNIRWNCPEASQLWRYHLHYFNYVTDLIVFGLTTGDHKRAAGVFRRLAVSWIEHNRITLGDGWHPYTISLRIVNWIYALDYWRLSLDENTDDIIRITASIFGQAQFLSASLEKDVRGNHLLKNLKALIWAGLKFQDQEAKNWFTRAMNILNAELNEQVLSDGGHFERTPGYHLDVLKDLIEIAEWLRNNHCDGAPVWLEEKLLAMLGFLRSILTPDGKVPLIKDTTLSEGQDPLKLLAAGEHYFKDAGRCSSEINYHFHATAPAYRSQYLKRSGFCIMSDSENGDFLVIDVGKVCPDYLPAHAHADMFSYELTIKNHKIITDSGVYEYAAGSWRNYFRSTRAHNTIEIEGRNQSDVWSSFRVGHRAKIGPVYFKDTQDYALVQATHDGYQKRFGVEHQRTLIWMKRKFWVIVDKLSCNRKTSIKNYLHFSPRIAIQYDTPDCWRLNAGDEDVWISAFGHASTQIIEGAKTSTYQGWYSDAFGCLQKNKVLELSACSEQDHYIVYGISKKMPLCIQHSLQDSMDPTIQFAYNKETFQLVLHLREFR